MVGVQATEKTISRWWWLGLAAGTVLNLLAEYRTIFPVGAIGAYTDAVSRTQENGATNICSGYLARKS